MKKIIFGIQIIATLFAYSISFSQSIIQTRMVHDDRVTPAIEFRNCIITQLGFHQFDGNYERATKQQLGVIGNDFIAPMRIGLAPAEGVLYKNVWHPIDGYKRTFIGIHTTIFSMDLNDGDASDDDWNVALKTSNTNRLIRDNSVKLTDAKLIYPSNFIQGEIDIKQSNKPHLMEYSNNAPKVTIDHIGVYGPWVIDVGNSPRHDHYNEIHPLEQLWWTEKTGNGRVYHLNMANDNSGRYNKSSNFDTDDDEHHPWQTNPMSHIYYIPFNIPLTGSQVDYSISLISKNNLTNKYKDGIEHYLVYKNKRLIHIKEPNEDILKIDFINTGIDPVAILRRANDTLIKGFIKIETSIGSARGDYAGNLFLKVTEKNPNLTERNTTIVVGERRGKIKVALQHIKCINADDGDPQEDVTGFIGVRAESTAFYPIQANQLADNAESPLLWSRLDGDAQKIKEGETITVNKSFTYSLPFKGSSLILIADLDEDDGNGDDNKTTLDDEDDKLEKDFSSNSVDEGRMVNGVVYKPIELNDLILNQPISRKMDFGSGGTKIEVSFEVELIEVSGDANTPIIIEHRD